MELERKMMAQMTLEKMTDLEKYIENQGKYTAKEVIASAGIHSIRCN